MVRSWAVVDWLAASVTYTVAPMLPSDSSTREPPRILLSSTVKRTFMEESSTTIF